VIFQRMTKTRQSIENKADGMYPVPTQMLLNFIDNLYNVLLSRKTELLAVIGFMLITMGVVVAQDSATPTPILAVMRE
jgi:hypothetical protein